MQATNMPSQSLQDEDQSVVRQGDVAIVSTLVRDPELRYARTGSAFARLVVAVDSPDGEEKEVEVLIWHDMAENAALSLKQGDRVVVVGELASTWPEEWDEAPPQRYIVARAIGPDLRYVTADLSSR